MRAVPNRIEHVLSLRAPSQVFRAVVPSVAVEMPNDEAATSGPAVEGESHKHVDERTATSRELDAEVTVMVQRAGQPATLGIQDGASARGHVASESRDGPALTHDFLGCLGGALHFSQQQRPPPYRSIHARASARSCSCVPARPRSSATRRQAAARYTRRPSERGARRARAASRRAARGSTAAGRPSTIYCSVDAPVPSRSSRHA